MPLARGALGVAAAGHRFPCRRLLRLRRRPSVLAKSRAVFDCILFSVDRRRSSPSLLAPIFLTPWQSLRLPRWKVAPVVGDVFLDDVDENVQPLAQLHHSLTRPWSFHIYHDLSRRCRGVGAARSSAAASKLAVAKAAASRRTPEPRSSLRMGRCGQSSIAIFGSAEACFGLRPAAAGCRSLQASLLAVPHSRTPSTAYCQQARRWPGLAPARADPRVAPIRVGRKAERNSRFRGHNGLT